MKITSEHRYSLELLREPSGELLVQEVLEQPDLLERLAAEARFEAAGRGTWPDEPEHLSALCGPWIREAGDPSLAGLRMELAHNRKPGERFAMEYPGEIVAGRGLELAASLVEEGTLREGDHYRVRLVSAQRPPSSASGSVASETEPMALVFESPFPVRRESLSRFGIGPDVIASAHAARPVFVERDVLQEAIDAAVRHGHEEVGTLLLGYLVEDPALRSAGCKTSWAIVITAQVAVEDPGATDTSFTFPPEAFRKARQLAELRGRGEQVVGSQHSHGWNCPNCVGKREIRNLFFSTVDERMTHHF
ncbi:MAG TPA: hypothetical protein VGY53_12405, partial [Isosphaeraceae bacterium]|nr:hypothetical protein [Isosphaeraceae bacterium]